MDANNELLAVFREEAEDLIERVRRQIDASGEQVVNDILRAVHTIKGGAATCDMTALKAVAHELENQLTSLKGAADGYGDGHRALLRDAMDRFERLLETGEAAGEPLPDQAPGFQLFDEAPVKKAEAAPVAAQEVLRVPVERVQKNTELASEVFLARNQLCYLVDQYRQGLIPPAEFFQRWEVLDSGFRKSVAELEAVAMSMRLMPIRAMLRRMEKTVRSYLAGETAKDIEFEIKGEEIELDKKIVDSLAEPLVHLTRNAMDHGVEPAEERRRAGKPGKARITLSVALEGNEVVIALADDGRGIDDQKVLASAKSKGLDVSNVRTKADAVDLIFRPGFSTAQSVSDVSGRGIGMDAVKSYAESAGGSITVQTEVKVGSTFTMRLPLAISVVQTVLASVNGQKFAISSSDLVETRKISYKDLRFNGTDAFFMRSGVCIPCFDVEDYLYLSQKSVDEGLKRRHFALCVVRTRHGLVAMKVPELLGNAEIAVKGFPDAGNQVPYVSGVSILATGEPAFVISLGRLYERVIRHGRGQDPKEAHLDAA